MLDNYNYQNYLSIDNKNGLLINRNDIYILDKYHFDYKKFTNLSELIFVIDNYLNENDGYQDDLDDLEEVLIRLSEFHYYIETIK